MGAAGAICRFCDEVIYGKSPFKWDICMPCERKIAVLIKDVPDPLEAECQD